MLGLRRGPEHSGIQALVYGQDAGGVAGVVAVARAVAAAEHAKRKTQE